MSLSKGPETANTRGGQMGKQTNSAPPANGIGTFKLQIPEPFQIANRGPSRQHLPESPKT